MRHRQLCTYRRLHWGSLGAANGNDDILSLDPSNKVFFTVRIDYDIWFTYPFSTLSSKFSTSLLLLFKFEIFNFLVSSDAECYSFSCHFILKTKTFFFAKEGITTRSLFTF